MAGQRLGERKKEGSEGLSGKEGKVQSVCEQKGGRVFGKGKRLKLQRGERLSSKGGQEVSERWVREGRGL